MSARHPTGAATITSLLALKLASHVLLPAGMDKCMYVKQPQRYLWAVTCIAEPFVVSHHFILKKIRFGGYKWLRPINSAMSKADGSFCCLCQSQHVYSIVFDNRGRQRADDNQPWDLPPYGQHPEWHGGLGEDHPQGHMGAFWWRLVYRYPVMLS